MVTGQTLSPLFEVKWGSGHWEDIGQKKEWLVESGVNLSGSLGWGRQQTLQPHHFLSRTLYILGSGLRAHFWGSWWWPGGEGRAGSQAATLTICVSQALSPETIQKATPSCYPSCFLLPSGPLLLQSHWSRSKSCHHQKEHPSPERSLSTSYSDQETKRLQRRESQPLPCRRCTLLSSLVKSFTWCLWLLGGPCLPGCGADTGLQDWASAAACTPKLHPAAVCAVSLRGLLPSPNVTHNYPLAPEDFGAQVKMQIRVFFFNVMRMIMRTWGQESHVICKLRKMP